MNVAVIGAGSNRARTAFIDHAISLLQQIADETAYRIHMTRRSYVVATRDAMPEALLARTRAV